MINIKFLRGTKAQNDAYIGKVGTVTLDLTDKSLRVHDGVTAGGKKIPNTTAVEQLIENYLFLHSNSGDHDSRYYTQTQVDNKIANIPSYDDSGIRTLINGKVDKVAGKGLSTNDFTNVLYDKLSTIESGAEKNAGDVFNAGGVYVNLRAQATTKSDVGLSDVDNTPDNAKPVSSAQQLALNDKVNVSDIVNGLTSPETNKPLSAAQGSILKTHIDNINALLNSDDTTLDELQEIVDYIKLNRTELESLGVSNIAGLQSALNNKVNVVSGKGLSTEDFTSGHKSKLDGVESGATADQTKADIDALNIDADTVDGLQASQFLRSDQNGAIDGTLTVDNHVKIHSEGSIGGTGIDAVLTSIQGSSWPEIRTVDTLGFAARITNDSGNTWTDILLAYDTGLFTYMGNEIWHSGNDGSGSGLDADTLDGRHANAFYEKSVFSSTGGVDTPVTRDGSGDIRARLFRSDYTTTNSDVGVIYTARNAANDFIRPSTPNQVKSALGIDANDVSGLSDAATTTVATIQAGTSKANVGLSNVRNVSSYSQTESNNLFYSKVSPGEHLDIGGEVKVNKELRVGGFTLVFNETTQSLDFFKSIVN